MKMAEIKQALIDFNPWWIKDFRIEYKDRDIYKNIQKFIPLKQILAFVGLRRVGKTTLIYKIIEDYINKRFEKRNILYFSFDDFKDVEIRNVLTEYENLNDKDLGNEQYLILFDEIQKLNNWENQLKRIYDTWSNFKIIISGSESLFLRKKSKETLAGRIFEFKIDKLSFKEFLIFKEKNNLKPYGLYKKELLKLLNEFSTSQGFPELINIGEKEIIKKYIKESIIDKVIYRDIVQLYKIDNISIIDTIIRIFSENPGQIVDITQLAGELNISRQTLSNYLTYLEDSFLIKKLYNFSKSIRKVERKLKKFYPAVISTNLLFAEDILSKSKVFEWLLVSQIEADFFWRDPYKNEVDIIKDGSIPIEVKYGKIETEGILSFMKKMKINKGIIISLEKEDIIKIEGFTIKVIPAFRFLLEQ